MMKRLYIKFLHYYYHDEIYKPEFWVEVLKDPHSLKAKLLSFFPTSEKLRFSIIDYIFCVKKVIYKETDEQILSLLINYYQFFKDVTDKELMQIYIFCHMFNLKPAFIQRKNDYHDENEV